MRRIIAAPAGDNLGNDDILGDDVPSPLKLVGTLFQSDLIRSKNHDQHMRKRFTVSAEKAT